MEKESMTIAVILSHINKSTQWSWLSREYKKNGVKHYFIILNEHETLLEKDLIQIGTPVYFFKTAGKFSLLVNFFKVIRVLIAHRPDIVHTSLPYGNLIGQSAAMATCISKRITTCENTSWAHDFQNTKQKIIDRFTFMVSRKIIATCETSKSYLVRAWHIKPDKIEVLNQAMDPADYENISEGNIREFQSQHGITQNDFVIGVVARFEFWKGHKYIIEAVDAIKSKIPGLRVVIVGSKGKDYEDIMKLIEQKGLGNTIHYLGFIDNLPLFFKSIDIHIHVPINEYVETFGLNIIEGMMADCPQILTKSGIAATTAKHNQNCLVVNYCDPAQIVDAISLYYSDPILRKRLSENARQDAAYFFSLRRKFEHSMQIYNSL